MKLLNAEQIKLWDQYTIQHEPVSSLDLMERAAYKCTDWLLKHRFHLQPIKIFCGKGNNGGDGLAIARQLIEEGIQPTVYVLETGNTGSEDFTANLKRLQKVSGNIHTIQSENDFPAIELNDVVIDALFGSGINRPLESLSAALVDNINNSRATVISIDIPSGMYLDMSSKNIPVIKAHHTLTFQSLKLCFLVAENASLFGKVEVLEIGLSKQFLSSTKTKFHLTELEDATALYQPRNEFSHKGNFGHALIIGGSETKTGAAIIAAEACAKTGAGLTSVHLLADNYSAINARCPEVMTLAGDELVKKNLSRFNAIGVGPGLGTDDIAQHIVSLLLENFEGFLVLDADALNIIAQNKELLHQLPPKSILTPHPKEWDRLFGEHTDEFERIKTALHQSRQLSCVIVLKGHHTLVAANGEGYFNTTGNPGLAKGGSGDCLTGIITSLLAQKYFPSSAAKLGVFIHGLAADIALNNESFESLLASDVTRNIGKAFKKLSNVS
jgi:hydroxyethylthiazole kinase-like uncharacterized protein yjeF